MCRKDKNMQHCSVVVLSQNNRNTYLVADFTCNIPLLVAPSLYAFPVGELHTTNTIPLAFYSADNPKSRVEQVRGHKQLLTTENEI